MLIESPEVLNIIQENHIKSIISLLDKHGRNHKVCVCISRLPDFGGGGEEELTIWYLPSGSGRLALSVCV